MIMSTFIESVDLSGKIVLPFVTYAVSGLSDVDQDYRRALPDAEVRDGIAIQGEEAAEASSDLDAWLGSHGLRSCSCQRGPGDDRTPSHCVA